MSEFLTLLKWSLLKIVYSKTRQNLVHKVLEKKGGGGCKTPLDSFFFLATNFLPSVLSQ